MKALSSFTLLLVAAFCLSHILGSTFSKLNEKHLKEALSSIQLPPNDDKGDVAQDYKYTWRHKRNNNNSSNSSKPSDDKAGVEAYVDAGELVLLENNLTVIHRQDALASSLFAQLAADYKYDRTAEAKNWDRYYEQVLGQVGWVLESSSFKDVQVDDFFVISEVVLKQFAVDFSGLDENTYKHLRQFLNKFNEKSPDEEDMVDMFYNITTHNNSIHFAVTVGSEYDGDDSLQLFTIRVSFEACEMARPYLFHLFDSECVGGRINLRVSQFLLNEEVYSKARDVIVQRLGSRLKHFVLKMKLN